MTRGPFSSAATITPGASTQLANMGHRFKLGWDLNLRPPLQHSFIYMALASQSTPLRDIHIRDIVCHCFFHFGSCPFSFLGFVPFFMHFRMQLPTLIICVPITVFAMPLGYFPHSLVDGIFLLISSWPFCYYPVLNSTWCKEISYFPHLYVLDSIAIII